MKNYLTKIQNKNPFQYKNRILSKIEKLAKKDKQINIKGVFDSFSDIQNIVFSYISFIEILWKNEEEKLNNKTIKEIYKECIQKNAKNIKSYEKIKLNSSKIFEMNDETKKKQYREILIGKLIRYGFGNIKILKIINGNDGFDALILNDTNNSIYIYYSCTNVFEIEDYFYDSYPIINKLIKNNRKRASNKIKEIYDSQQIQAKELLETILNANINNKIFLGGYSLGGSLAETAYLSQYQKSNNKIENIKNVILFNPYHNNLSKKEIDIIKSSNKFKIFVGEGDPVSAFFNYDELKSISKPIYINYKKEILENKNIIDNGNGLLNPVINELKKQLCDKIKKSCEKINKEKNKVPHFIKEKILLELYEIINKIEKKDTNIINIIDFISNFYTKINPLLKKLNIKYDLAFIYVLRYIELLISGTHLIYPIEENKELSFDKQGIIKNKIEKNSVEHIVTYPSFDEVSKEMFGINIYNEVERIIKKEQ